MIARRLDDTLARQMLWIAELDSFAGIRRWFDALVERSRRAAIGRVGYVEPDAVQVGRLD